MMPLESGMLLNGDLDVEEDQGAEVIGESATESTAPSSEAKVWLSILQIQPKNQ